MTRFWRAVLLGLAALLLLDGLRYALPQYLGRVGTELMVVEWILYAAVGCFATTAGRAWVGAAAAALVALVQVGVLAVLASSFRTWPDGAVLGAGLIGMGALLGLLGAREAKWMRRGSRRIGA